MFQKILVPLDGSPLAEQAIPTAVSIARAAQARIEVLMVHEGWSDSRYIDSIAADIRSSDGEAPVQVMGTIVHGSPAEAIVARTREISADLIVMTSHGRTGLSRLWLGSVADHVVRATTIPVLILPADADENAARHMVEPFAHLLVPCDGSPLSADALPVAADFAQLSGATVTLLQISPVVPAMLPVDPSVPTPAYPVIPDEEATVRLATDVRHGLDEVAAKLAKEAGLKVRAVVEVAQNASDRIVEYAHVHRADLIVMSTHGRGASRWLLGSVADKVLRASGLPTVLRRPAKIAESIAHDAKSVERQLTG